MPYTDCGRVLACGSNAFGQLGVGQTVTHTAHPQVVEVSTWAVYILLTVRNKI